jgi:metal-responsive CopG/Arc/MetJ family transcriptional regulator
MMARISLTLPDELLAAIDEAARREHRSRSQLLREAVRHYLRVTSWTDFSDSTPTKAVGTIEQLRIQALVRGQTADNAVDLIRSFRGPLFVPIAEPVKPEP